MAKKKKEEPVVDNETGSIKVKEKVEKQPTGNETKGDVTKVKAKMKKAPEDLSKETITKVDLSKPLDNETKEDSVIQTDIEKPETDTTEKETKSIVEEITKEERVEKIAEKVEEVITESIESGESLPENIQKLVDFMEQTGGDLHDYVKLDQDYSKMDNQTVLEEYYRQTKPHLSTEERNFLMEDQFSYDEEEDSEKEIKRKKLALKEQVANAKSHLDGQKSKYYSEIKSGSKLTKEQQEAINFYNEQRGVAKNNEVITNDFINKTNKLFNDEFKGFEYNIGDKRFRYNINDVSKVKESQSDINEFIGKFLDESGKMAKESEYHKSLFTAMNADAIANHFYEQGKADAMKDSVAESKNINMNPRQELNQDYGTNDVKVRVLNDDTSSDFKFKIKNKK